VCEGVVEVASLLLEDSDCDLDACCAQFRESLAAHLRIRVLGCYDAAADSCCYERIGAGSGAAVMAAGFEGDVGRGSFGGETALHSLLEGYDLRVVAVGVEVCAFADDFGMTAVGWCLGEDTAHLWIWRCQSYGLGCELEGSVHEAFVDGMSCHLFYALADAPFMAGTPSLPSKCMQSIHIKYFESGPRNAQA